jgi:hypothetical protein
LKRLPMYFDARPTSACDADGSPKAASPREAGLVVVL